MAEIPLMDLLTGAPEEVNDGSRVSYAASGGVKISRLYDVTRHTFRLGWEVLSDDELTELRVFYQENRFLDVEYSDPFTGLLYSVKMLSPPQITDKTSTYVGVEMVVAGVLV